VRAGPPAAGGRDDLARAEALRDLDGHLTGTAGGAEDEHVLAGLEGHPLAQRHPRRHGRVHRRGYRDGIGALGQHDAAAGVDDGLLGHRAHGGVRQDEIAQPPVGAAPHAVDARHERQFTGAGVVRPVGLRPDPRVQAGGEHADEQLVLAGWLGDRELLVAGSGVERGDDSGLHDDPPYSWYYKLL
jgi:hypothetical protein